MSDRFDLVAAVNYAGRDGEEKTRFVRCGMGFINDAGKVRVKIDNLPVGQGWDGWLSLMPPREQEGNTQTTQPAARTQKPAARKPDDFDDDVPF